MSTKGFGINNAVRFSEHASWEVIEAKHRHLTTQKLFYVIISRAKESAKIFTDNKKELINTFTRSKRQ